tara:strand:+ start:195 stop:485 length:291 start_codon:yes stop_codon:yes gene_type:complete
MIPTVESAIRSLPDINDDGIKAILDGERKAVKVAVASFEIPSANKTYLDKMIEIYGKQTIGERVYIYFNPIEKRKGAKDNAVWSLSADLFVSYVSN